MDIVPFRTFPDADRGTHAAEALFDDGFENGSQDEDDQEYVLEDDTEEDAETSEDEEELATEVHDLEQDGGLPFSSSPQSSEARHESNSSSKMFRKRSVEDTDRRGLSILLRDPSSSSKRIDLNGQNIWIGPYENPLLDEHYDADATQARIKRVKRSHPQRTTRSACGLKDTSSLKGNKRGSYLSQSRNVRFEDEGLETPVTIIAQQDTSGSDDEDFEPPPESTSGSSESDKENVSPGDAANDLNSAGTHPASIAGQPSGILKPAIDRSPPSEKPSSSHASSSESASDSSWKTSSSSDASYSDSKSKSTSEADSNSDSDSTSSSDSDSDLEYEKVASESNASPNRTHKIHLPSSNTAKVSAEPEKAAAPTTALQPSSQQVPPGQGRKLTKQRNQRRRIASRFRKAKEAGLIPSSSSRADFMKWGEENGTSYGDNAKAAQAESGQALLVSSTVAKGSTEEYLAAALQAKKTELLQSLGGGTNAKVASNETLPTMVDDRSHMTSNETLQAMVDEPTDLIPATQHVTVQDRMILDEAGNLRRHDLQEPNQSLSNTLARPRVSDKCATTTPQSDVLDGTPNKRRGRLDIASSRRMLFGSLGVRVPKSQEEVNAVRQKLSANIRVAPQPKPDASLKSADVEQTEIDADDSWKTKLMLKAVECCHEGVELSTPPFPFVQRWDPQQKGSFNNRRLSKKQKRRASQNYGNIGAEQPHEKYIFSHKYVFKEHKSAFDARSEDQSALYPTLSEEYQSAANEQLLRDSGVLSTNTDTKVVVNGSPQIPTNIETYSPLSPDNVAQGSTIAFKQLEVSARTCWQPQVSEYRIGAIETVLRETEPWTVCLRLVNNDQNDKADKYDEATGERIYGKFEMAMPGDEEDDTYLEINFDDMIEPKLIQSSQSATDQVERGEQVLLDLESLVQVKETPQDSLIGPKDAHVEQDLPTTSVVEDSVSQERRHSFQNGENPLSSDGPDLASRKEVSLLIKGAGFRTSLDPEAARGLEDLREEREEEIQDTGENDDYDHDLVGFPSFNGFGSSPPRMNDDDEQTDENGVQEVDAEFDGNDDEGDLSEQVLDDEADNEEISKSGFKLTMENPDQYDASDPNSNQRFEERLKQNSHSLGWYVANFRGNAIHPDLTYESSHNEVFDTTETNNFEGVSSDKAINTTDLNNLDGTTEISNLDGPSYDMIGTQAAPKAGTSSPNPLPSPIHMPMKSQDLASAQSSDQLPETIPPTSTSESNGDSSPLQQPFRDFSKSPSRSVVAPVAQGSSPFLQSKAEKTLAVREGQDLGREASYDSLSRVDSYKPSESERGSGSETELPSFETMFPSQRSSARSPIQLSSNPPRPESSSPPGRPFNNDRISLGATEKEFSLPDDAKGASSLTASQQKIKKEQFSQSQTSIKEEQLSQSINLFDDDGLDDYQSLDYEDRYGDLGTQIPNRAPDNASARKTEQSTRPKEAVIVDLTQDSDLQSPGGSDYGAGKKTRGAKGKKNGGRGTQSLGGEIFGSDIIRASRKRVMERTRSRV